MRPLSAGASTPGAQRASHRNTAPSDDTVPYGDTVPCVGTVPCVVTIAGTDPTGGAGSAADIKSIHAAGGYALPVTTAVLAQNSSRVTHIEHMSPTVVRAQLDAIAEHARIDAVKIGMLGTAANVQAVAEWLSEAKPQLIVVDPVMISSSGTALIAPEAFPEVAALCAAADVVTPNALELAELTGSTRGENHADVCNQARAWAERHGNVVIAKTGHLDSEQTTNYWIESGAEPIAIHTQRVDSSATQGTGCALASALTTRLAAGDAPAQALAWASDWLHHAISHGERLDVTLTRGQPLAGPVDHFHHVRAAMPQPHMPQPEAPAPPGPLQHSSGACEGGGSK
ncbi:PfkB family carbohydrate kinase [Pseudoglutamicibacter cumminsii]|uniref:PfkB family carbohydrate kinase n=1 Tax=Pseudoglutamicibacter cumminsii TaxID=156979 RepID=UPI00195CC8F1|nr:hydroxymethylpyrimidine/phosphomethylpyrimidine kinase [Pseudoglutamicibacter cumminsii]